MAHPHREAAKRDLKRRLAAFRHGEEVKDTHEIAKMVTEGVHAHERHDHPGEKLTRLKLRRGGPAKEVEGRASRKRIDRADGGRTRTRLRRDLGGAAPGVTTAPTAGQPGAMPGAGQPQMSPQQAQQMQAVMRAKQAQAAGARQPGVAPAGMAKRGGRMHRAEGGRTKAKGAGKGARVNVIVTGGGQPQERPVPVPVPVRRPAPPAGGGAPPMGGGAPPRPMPPAMGGGMGGAPVAGMGGAPMPGAMRRSGGRAKKQA